MVRRFLLVCGVLLVAGLGAWAEDVPVPGSAMKYPSKVEGKLGNKHVRMNLTGVAMRTKYFFNVYTIGSYVQEGAQVKTASQLAAVNACKQLHCFMERTVSGKDFARAMRTAIRRNYPAPAFEKEIQQLTEKMEGQTANKGDHILLTHLPGVGLHCVLVGKMQFLIANPAFSRAIWDIYLGPKNVGEKVKRDLVSRL